MRIVTDTQTGTVVLSETDFAGHEHIVVGSTGFAGDIPAQTVMEAAAELRSFSSPDQRVN